MGFAAIADAHPDPLSGMSAVLHLGTQRLRQRGARFVPGRYGNAGRPTPSCQLDRLKCPAHEWATAAAGDGDDVHTGAVSREQTTVHIVMFEGAGLAEVFDQASAWARKTDNATVTVRASSISYLPGEDSRDGAVLSIAFQDSTGIHPLPWGTPEQFAASQQVLRGHLDAHGAPDMARPRWDGSPAG
jgi:hypothetical protein